MANKQPSLRNMFSRGRSKSPAEDAAGSNSDSSCLKADVNSSSDRLSPALPVSRTPSASPNARVPKKLKKKSPNLDNSASLPPSVAAPDERDKSPYNSPATMTAASRSDIRHTERHQVESAAPTISRTKKSAVEASAKPTSPSLKNGLGSWSSSTAETTPKYLYLSTHAKKSGQAQKNRWPVDRPREESNDEGSGTEDLATMSPRSTKSEPTTSDNKYHNVRDRRNSINPIVNCTSFYKAVRDPDNTEKEGRRTSSPVSPFRDTAGTKLDNSPVSSLSETSVDSRDALLLPHERTTLADTFNVSTHNGKIDSRDEVRDLAKARASLQKKNKTAKRKHGFSPKGKIERHGFDLPAPIHSSDVARAALMETLQKINADKNATTEERNTVAQELPREASDVLELSPRSPVKPATPVKSAASDPPPPSLLVPQPLARGMRTLQNQEQDPVGEERIAHPVKIQYDPPITLIAGILQRGFKRWRCCRCQCFTHYENYVCSRLDCMHRRCEGKCDTFEP